MHTYRAYGLGIHSAWPLPELVESQAAADLVFRPGAVAEPPPADPTQPPRFSRSWLAGSSIGLRVNEAGRFLVSGGREVTVDALPGVESRVLRLSLLGPVLALALQQRGGVVLHASAVAVGGAAAPVAVGFLGHSGWGKSTMAGALVQRGLRLVADDFIAVPAPPAEGGLPLIYPGFPQLKLWPEAAETLGADAAALHALHPTLPKRGQRLAEAFAAEPLPLARLYVLAEGEAVAITPVTGQAALIEVVRHSFTATLMSRLDPAGHFRLCASLLRAVPLFRLQRPRDLAQLGEVAARVAEHLNAGHAVAAETAPASAP